MKWARRMTVAALVLSAGVAQCEGLGYRSEASESAGSDYVLGSGDQIKIWALGLQEVTDRTFRIDARGGVDLPLVGRVEAEGLTLGQFREELLKRLESQVWKPQVSVEIAQYGSQPVTVLGAVTQPGVHQLQGRKTLAEMLSLAGGLRQDAGHEVKITRAKRFGAVPLVSAHWDATGEYSVADVQVRGLLAADNPADNILVRPHDMITVPTAEKVYVVGDVGKAGSIVLNERQTISVLQALSVAEGLGRAAKPQDARILRTPAGGSQRIEVPVDLRKILAGKSEDVNMQANDILFVPDSTPKKVAVRTLEAMIQTATGVVIWRR